MHVALIPALSGKRERGRLPFSRKAGAGGAKRPIRESVTPSQKPLLAALAGQRQPRPPIWLMRQAGRYLPEYREIRARAATFLDFCYTPALAVEATLQPIRRFGFDAAILFSDILVVPDALGQHVSFESGEGPRLAAIGDAAGLARLRDAPDWTKLAPVFEALDRLKTSLPRDVALIGFLRRSLDGRELYGGGAGHARSGAGAAFRLSAAEAVLRIDRADRRRLGRISCASAGRGRGSGADLRLVGGGFAAGGIRALVREAGRVADCESAREPRRMRRSSPFRAGRRRGSGNSSTSPASPRSASTRRWTRGPPSPPCPARLRCRAISIPSRWSRAVSALDEGIDRVLRGFEGRAHIFNLGHGILPETPVEHVERLVARVRAA